MLDIALKNIGRQRTRTFLTVLGIVIGIAAIVALGSVAEGIDALVETSMEKMVGKIIVYEAEASLLTFFQGSEISNDEIQELLDVPGVKDVIPMSYRIEGTEGLQFRQPEMVIGMPADKIEYFKGEEVEMYDGRELEAGDDDVVIIGKDIADQRNLGIGDEYDIGDESFQIVGIIEKTDDPDIDMSAIIHIDTLNDIMETEDVPTAYVIPEDIGDTEIVADNIKDTFEEFNAITDVEMARQVGAMVDNIRLFTFGIAGIAAVVGGLGVMNTMIMAVMERRREIGVMKALGATNRMILMQFLTESAMMSVIGGVLGVGIGTLLALAVGFFTSFAITPTVTPTLALTGLGFAFFLGILGGLYPSRKAAKLDAVEALRYE